MDLIYPKFFDVEYGTIISLIGLLFAAIQTIKIRNLKKERTRKIWVTISSTKALMEDLESDDPKQAFGKVCELFRQLLLQAVLEEKKYSISTIDASRNTGKLSSNWQVKQAYALLLTEEIDKKMAKDIDEIYKDWDNLKEDHEFNHGKPSENKTKNHHKN